MTEELTAPVQKNFYAVGHKYSVLWGDSKKIATYMGTYLLSDKRISHVFAWECPLNEPVDEIACFTMSHAFPDSLAQEQISDLEG